MPSESNLEFQAMMEKAQRQKLLVRHQNEIIATYDKAFRDAFNELKTFENNTAVAAAQAAYTKQLYEELNALNKKYVGKVSQQTLDMHRDMIKQIAGIKRNMTPQQRKFMDAIDKNVRICNQRAVETMIKGGIYKDGMGLSKRIWNSAKMSERKIDVAIRSCMARGISSAEAAGIIKEFGNGGHRTWDRKKIQEKLGSGYARSFSGGIDYEALRLMRTTHTHTAQLAVKESAKVNPYVGKVKWHSVHAAGRTCEQCIARDGRVFKLDQMPFDHPNGMCWMESVFVNEKGMIMTPEKMAQDMRAWVEGKPNSGTMDKVYKDIPMGNTSSKKAPKSIPYSRKYPELHEKLKSELGHIPNSTKKINEILADLDKMPEDIKQVYLKYGVKKFKYGSTPDTPGTAFYRPSDGRVYLEIGKKLPGREGKNDVLFHEWGHLIDANVYEDKFRQFKGVRLSNTVSSQVGLTDALKQDLTASIRKLKRNGLTVEEAEKQISMMLKRADTKAIAISDSCKGITKGRVKGEWGHSDDYYIRYADKGYITEEDSVNITCDGELFAETLAMCQYPENIKWMETHFPTYMETFWKAIKTLNK